MLTRMERWSRTGNAAREAVFGIYEYRKAVFMRDAAQ